MGRTPRVFLGLVLLLCGLRTGFCVLTVRTEPASGSFIDDFEGALNISLFCEVEENEIRQQIVWSLQTAEDVRTGANPGPIDDTKFVESGESVISQDVLVSLNTNLTVLELTAELDQAIIFCGYSESTRLANFTLRTYKPPVLNNVEAISKRENEMFFLDLSEGNRPAFPFPSSFMWSRDRGGELVNETGQRVYNYSSVFIKSVQPSDSGNYTLTATNYLPDGTTVVGTDTGSFFLDVLFGARLSRGDESVAVAQGERVTLVCGRDLRGNPTPQIEWTDSGGSPVTDGGRFTVSSSEEIVSLTITNTVPGDSGNWTCSAQVFQSDTTEVGDAVEYSIRLVVVVPPAAPEDFQLETTGPSWIFLSWGYGDRGSPELSRHIILVSGGGVMRNITVESNEERGNVTGLLPGTQYTFRVVAVSVYGDVSAESPPSDLFMATTEVSVPAPECTADPEVEDTRLVVRWSYTHTGGLPITAVDVQFQEDASSSRTSFSDVDSSEVAGSGQMVEEGEASIPLPEAGIRYRFYVTATNSEGSTTTECPDLLLTIGKPAKPNSPTLNTGDDSVVVVVSTDHSGVGSSRDNFQFIVQVIDAADPMKPPIDITQGAPCSTTEGTCRTTITLTLDDLTAGRLYSIRVRAMNRFGESESIDSFPFSIGRSGTDSSSGSSGESDSSMAGAIVGGVIGALVIVALLVLIVILAVYILFKLRSKSLSSRDGGGTYRVEGGNRQGVKIEEVDIDLGKELGSHQLPDGANKELHYAELEHFQKPAERASPETPRSPEEAVQYATIEQISGKGKKSDGNSSQAVEGGEGGEGGEGDKAQTSSTFV